MHPNAINTSSAAAQEARDIRLEVFRSISELITHLTVHIACPWCPTQPCTTILQTQVLKLHKKIKVDSRLEVFRRISDWITHLTVLLARSWCQISYHAQWNHKTKVWKCIRSSCCTLQVISKFNPHLAVPLAWLCCHEQAVTHQDLTVLHYWWSNHFLKLTRDIRCRAS